MQRVRRVLDEVKSSYLTEARLTAAKKQYLGQLLVAEDNNEGLALAVGKSYLRHGILLSPEEQRSRIESVSLDDMRRVAHEMLDADSWSLLVFQP